MSVYCPDAPCPTPEQARGCNDCECDCCPDPDKHKEGQGSGCPAIPSPCMIPESERAYEEELRGLIRVNLQQEEYHRRQRQGLETRLHALRGEHVVRRLQQGCPIAFVYSCVLEDGTMCPFYHEGQCVKAEKSEEAEA